MPNNGNGHRNGSRCPRCIGGTLIRENGDALCLNCGHRITLPSKNGPARDYLTEGIIARMLLDDTNEIEDVSDGDFRLAGMAA